jgi:hypothetical protein
VRYHKSIRQNGGILQVGTVKVKVQTHQKGQPILELRYLGMYSDMYVGITQVFKSL